MKTGTIIASIGVSLLVCGAALALTEEQIVTAEIAAELGFSVAAVPGEDRLIAYTVGRKIANAPRDNAGTARIRWVGTLTIRDAKGVIVQCDVEAHQEKDTVAYKFAVAGDHVADADFKLIAFPSTESGQWAGRGSEVYEFRLADFKAAKPTS